MLDLINVWSEDTLMKILKFAVTFLFFFSQIFGRRKMGSLESCPSSNSGFAKYLPYGLDFSHPLTPGSLIYRMEMVLLSHR